MVDWGDAYSFCRIPFNAILSLCELIRIPSLVGYQSRYKKCFAILAIVVSKRGVVTAAIKRICRLSWLAETVERVLDTSRKERTGSGREQ